MINTELGDLRRTHYVDELSKVGDGQSVTIMGWILTVRNHGNLTFVTIRDKNGDIQIVAKKGECTDFIRKKISLLKTHSSVAIVGFVRESKKAPGGFEIVPTELRVFSDVQKIPPIDPLAKTIKNIETRLQVRPIDLRRDILRHVFQTRSWVLSSQLTQKWAKSSTWKSMRCFQTIIIFEKKTVLKPLHAVERCLHRTGTLMA